MNRIIISIIAFIVCVSYTEAQNKTLLVQRINEIKQQNDVYYWDQATYPDADSAKVVATKRLLLGVNIDRNKTNKLSVEDLMPHANYINIDRGKLRQYFVYIKKTDAAAINNVLSSTHIADNPVVGVPFSPSNSSFNQRSFVPDAFVQRIMETKDFMNVYKLLKSLQAQGQILQFGKLKDVEDYRSLDLILFDMQSQKIVTMLSPVTASGYRQNVVDGKEDSLENYPTNMTAVIWYIKK